MFLLLDKDFMLPFRSISSLGYHITTMKLSQSFTCQKYDIPIGVLWGGWIWVNIWYLFVKDRMDKWGTYQILSHRMDFGVYSFKKTLQSALFIRFRSVILGYKPIFKLTLKWIKIKEHFEIYDQNNLVNYDLWYKIMSK